MTVESDPAIERRREVGARRLPLTAMLSTMPSLLASVRAPLLVGLLGLACMATTVSDHTNNWAVLVCTSRFWCVSARSPSGGHRQVARG